MEDTDRHSRIAAPLHPEVVQHAEEYVRSVRPMSAVAGLYTEGGR